ALCLGLGNPPLASLALDLEVLRGLVPERGDLGLELRRVFRVALPEQVRLVRVALVSLGELVLLSPAKLGELFRARLGLLFGAWGAPFEVLARLLGLLLVRLERIELLLLLRERSLLSEDLVVEVGLLSLEAERSLADFDDLLVLPRQAFLEREDLLVF